MDDRPKNLRSMLSEAKDTSDLMVDLAYAAVYFSDHDMAYEVRDLEEKMSELVHQMRRVCILASRRPREAEAMASVLQVVTSIERIANDAVDISRIVTHRLGIPDELIADLSGAEEVSHRLVVSEASDLAHRRLAELALPVATGMRIVAVKSGREWATELDGDTVLVPGDTLFLRGGPSGITRLRELAGVSALAPRPPDATGISDLDHAVDLLVEMKNISEVAVGLAYSALVLQDRGLVAEVRHLEDRLDTMHDELELWVLRASRHDVDPSKLRGLLHLAQAAEDLGDQAQAMVWLLEHDEDVHPILRLALGEADEVVMWCPVAEHSDAAGASLGSLAFRVDSGFTVLAVQRGGRYLYRPTGVTQLEASDELIAHGPEEGRARFAERCGWQVTPDASGADISLVPLDHQR